MRVLIVARGYPTKKYKMNGIFEFDQAKALVYSGVNVVYAAIDMRSIRRWRKWGIETKIVNGVKIYAINLPLGRIPKQLLRVISKFGLIYLYKKIINEQGKPDIIHAHFSGIGFVASILKEKYNIPFVLTEHFSGIMKQPITKDIFKIAKIAYSKADKIIAVSPELKNIIYEKFEKNAIYIPNIVDTNLFSYANKDNKNTFSFVSVGSLIYGKRMDLTIEAFIDAFKGSDKVFLTIFGEGPERQKLEELVRINKMEKQIKLMGMQSRKVIADYLKECDCFVLASQTETFGVVYIEAMASGLPVIATKCGGPESFVNEENGVLIPVDNKDALVTAMKNMYSGKYKYDKKTISADTIKKFSPKTISKKLTDVYEDALKEKEEL
jgi:glycosyltransferase involved in cell wall biosynthesis